MTADHDSNHIFRDDQWSEVRIARILWISFYVLVSAALALLTLATLNRCPGHLPESMPPIPASPIMIDVVEQRGTLPDIRVTVPVLLSPAIKRASENLPNRNR